MKEGERDIELGKERERERERDKERDREKWQGILCVAV